MISSACSRSVVQFVESTLHSGSLVLRRFRRDIAHYATGGIYLNFIGDEGEDRVRAAFGDEKYGRLAAIKAEWDPGNVFSGNQNIKPLANLQVRPEFRWDRSSLGTAYSGHDDQITAGVGVAYLY